MYRHTTRRSRLVPLAVLAILVAFAVSASAGAVSTKDDLPQAPQTTTSKATVKRLTKQLKKLTKRVIALEEKNVPGFPSSLPPSGPARGDLTGNYPNPTIANNVVGPGKIPDETLTGFEIAPDSLYANDLATDSVGATELKGSNVVIGTGLALPPDGVARTATVTCPTGQQLTGGGSSVSKNARILDSAPSLSVANRWELRADNHSNETQTVYAWAVCLPA